MTRAVPSGLQAHFDGSVTSEASLWRVTRRDGPVLRLTSHDQDVSFGGNTYKAAVGYQRTDLASDSTLAVNSIDIQGILNSTAVNDTDLSGGRYDYAEVRVSLINWKNPDGDGETSVTKGWIGEVQLDEPSGRFSTELRGLTQVFAQNIVEQYGRSCRYNFGDDRCTQPVLPDIIQNNTAYAVGDIVRVRLPAADIAVLHAPGVTDADDDSQYAAVGTVGSTAAAADSSKVRNLAANFRFTPAGGPTESPSNSFVSWPDAVQHTIGVEPFTIEMWVNYDAIFTGGIGNILASQYTATGTQRAWILAVSEAANAVPGLQFVRYADGDSTTTNRVSVPLGEFTPIINNWYHIAVARDEYHRLRIFVNGKQRATENFPFDIFDSTALIRLGMFDSAPGNNRHFEGSIEDFRMVVGAAVYTEDFTPPGALTSTFSDPLTLTEDYNDTNYRVTVAGTTDATLPFVFHSTTSSVAVGPTTLSVTAPSTFTRPAGSFIDDGILTDMVIITTGFTNAANNGTFRVTGAVTAGSFDVTAASLVTEVGTGDEVMSQSNQSGGVVFAVDTALRVAGEVLTVNSQSQIVVGPPPSGGLIDNDTLFPNDEFNYGVLTFDSGLNAGISMDVKDYVTLTETITLKGPMPFPITVGDKIGVHIGCNKELSRCKALGNVLNYGGYPFIPSPDEFLRYPDSPY